MPSRTLPRTGLLAVVCALLAMLAAPAIAPAAAPKTPKPLASALTSLRTELRGLPRGTTVRRSVPKIAAAVRAGRYCVAKRRISSMRKGLRGKGARRIALKRRAALSSKALRVQALLLADTRTKRCGGAQTAPVGGASSSRVVKSTPQELTLNVQLPAPTLVPKTGGGKAYEQLVMPGLSTTAPAGEPGVPSMAESFGIPEGAKVEVTAQDTAGYTLDGVDLYPTQPQPLDGLADDPKFADKPFELDRGAYASDSSFPKKPAAAAELGELRDLNVGQLALAGAQYQPKAKKLKVFTSMQVSIKFTGGQGTFGKPGIADPWERSFHKLYGQALSNASTVFEHLTAGTYVVRPCGEELLVITSPGLRAAADTFAAARNTRGILTRVFETGNGAGRAGSTADQIRTFAQGRVAQSGCVRPSYLLLFGNTANVPTFDGDPGIPNVPSDLDYTLKFRELYLPNMSTGRIPAATLDQANTMVGKITGYENTPPISAAFYKRATVTGFFQGTGTTDDRGFVRTAEWARGVLRKNKKAVSRVYTTMASNPTYFDTGEELPAALKKPGYPWDGDGNDVRDQINAGRFLVMHRDHGAPTWVGDPDITQTHIDGMNNGALLPVFFSINCSSGRYDDPGTPSFAENLIRRSGGGVAGVVAASRDSPSELNNRFAMGLLDAVWPNAMPYAGSNTPIKRMGDVLNSAKLHVILQAATINAFYDDRGWGSATADIRLENRLYQYFGDPTMEIRTQRPLFLANPSVVYSGSLSAQLGTSAAGAAATLLQNGVPIGRATVAGDGSVTVNPLEEAKGKLELVVDQDGYEKTVVPVRDALPASDPLPATPPVQETPQAPAEKPDLVVTGARVQLVPGVFTVAIYETVVTIKNQGKGTAGPFSSTLFGRAVNQRLATTVALPRVQSLAPGASTQVAVRAVYNSQVRLTADSASEVAETDEANNVLEVTPTLPG
ncbi:MAG: hypothetical protein JHC95_07515 [Solirubrobacteraceae bacterium]|nr:hypothetical protein [Solirubrobacteraceae bacterium]